MPTREEEQTEAIRALHRRCTELEEEGRRYRVAHAGVEERMAAAITKAEERERAAAAKEQAAGLALAQLEAARKDVAAREAAAVKRERDADARVAAALDAVQARDVKLGELEARLARVEKPAGNAVEEGT